MKISRFARGAAALMTAFLLLCLCGCDIQELSTLRAFAKPFPQGMRARGHKS